jgi:prevent-host-death family protein
MTTHITAYETKTKQAEIFRRAAAGEHFLVTNNGKPQVVIRSAQTVAKQEITEALEALSEIQTGQLERAQHVDLKTLIEEGRD